jgi:hypothetical protein
MSMFIIIIIIIIIITCGPVPWGVPAHKVDKAAAWVGGFEGAHVGQQHAPL